MSSAREQGQNSMLRTPEPPFPHSSGCLLLCSWLVPRVGKLSPAAPGTPLPLLAKRLLTSVLIRRTLGLRHLLPSLANLYANHILKSEVKRKSPSLKCRRESVPIRGEVHSPTGIWADARPVDGCKSSIIDFKMLCVYVQSWRRDFPFFFFFKN